MYELRVRATRTDVRQYGCTSTPVLTRLQLYVSYWPRTAGDIIIFAVAAINRCTANAHHAWTGTDG
eukprot:COSAG01_NODE_53519_length_338_cov_2.619247_1_plen_65_part_10